VLLSYFKAFTNFLIHASLLHTSIIAEDDNDDDHDNDVTTYLTGSGSGFGSGSAPVEVPFLHEGDVTELVLKLDSLQRGSVMLCSVLFCSVQCDAPSRRVVYFRVLSCDV